MQFHGYQVIRTTACVWAELFKSHGAELEVFSSNTSISTGEIETTYGLPGSDFPLVGVRTLIEQPENPMSSRSHQYFLIVASKEPA